MKKNYSANIESWAKSCAKVVKESIDVDPHRDAKPTTVVTFESPGGISDITLAGDVEANEFILEILVAALKKRTDQSMIAFYVP